MKLRTGKPGGLVRSSVPESLKNNSPVSRMCKECYEFADKNDISNCTDTDGACPKGRAMGRLHASIQGGKRI